MATTTWISHTDHGILCVMFTKVSTTILIKMNHYQVSTSVDAGHLGASLSKHYRLPHGWIIVGTHQITMVKVLLCNAQSETFHHTSAMLLAAPL